LFAEPEPHVVEAEPEPHVVEKELPKRPDGYDVIDIGSSKGKGSINFIQDALNALFGDDDYAQRKKAVLDFRTLGLDNNPEKVKTCIKAQEGTTNNCEEADILTLTLDSLKTMSKRVVRGNSYWHVLEHIPNCELAEEMWIKAASLSKSFSIFHGPAYDDEMSASGEEPIGYHRFYENWSGHRCHFNSTMLEHAMERTERTTAYVIVNHGPIESTDHGHILPKETPKDSHRYNPEIHPPKEYKPLDKVRYEEMWGCAIYDDIEQANGMSIFVALCLRDVMNDHKKSPGYKVVSCSFGPYTGAECVQQLSLKAMNTIVDFLKLDLGGLVKSVA